MEEEAPDISDGNDEAPLITDDEEATPVISDEEAPVISDDAEAPVISGVDDGEAPVTSSDEEKLVYTDSEDDLSPDDHVIHNWGGGDTTVETSDTISNTIAFCNMDWDKVNAQDIYGQLLASLLLLIVYNYVVLANSFKPVGGRIVNVTVYTSDYGLEQLANETTHGPNTTDDSTEALRQYQLQRLRCYYTLLTSIIIT